MKRTLILGFAILSIFSSCKEDEEIVDKCSNGFVDAGENGVDCGGNCPPCPVYEPASIYLECNGVSVEPDSKSLTYQNGYWTLNVSNDTIAFQFNLGNNPAIGFYPMDPAGCIASKNSIFYLNSSNGSYAISAHNTETKKMSGFFSADFTRTGFTDTLKVRNGQFEFLPY